MYYQPVTHTSPKDLHVLIAGGGIGGIALGLMLSRANISFTILERSEKVRPVGSAISLGPNVLRLFDQLGIGQEIRKASKKVSRMAYYDSVGDARKGKPNSYAEMMFVEERYGYCTLVIPRSVLYNILSSKVPQSNILLGKRVVKVVEHESSPEYKEGSVTCHCSDGSEYTGSLLVGADGTYSTIRGLLYQDLDRQGALDPRDRRPLPPFQHCMVGVTEPLDPEEFKVLQDEYIDFQVIRGGGSNDTESQHSIWLMPLANNQVAWNIFYRYDKDTIQGYYDAVDYYNPPKTGSATTTLLDNDDDSSVNSDYSLATMAHEKAWRSVQEASREQALRLQDSHRSVPNPLSARGGTLGDLFDKTRKELISSVTMEQGFYHTWYHRRIVLLGDACHKSLPYGGQGANQAILDGVALVNNLVQLESTDVLNLTGCFHDYVQQRASVADTARVGSAFYGYLFGGDSWMATLFRLSYFRLMPQSVIYWFADPFFQNRPLLSFLPYVRDYGSCAAAPAMNEPEHRIVQTIV
ncbi:hypothetical protein BGW41_003341 [Actinomortierella wolfii]|nr:hypothetical protein BGW41_003341 [Actinomortierella wolfii]